MPTTAIRSRICARRAGGVAELELEQPLDVRPGDLVTGLIGDVPRLLTVWAVRGSLLEVSGLIDEDATEVRISEVLRPDEHTVDSAGFAIATVVEGRHGCYRLTLPPDVGPGDSAAAFLAELRQGIRERDKLTLRPFERDGRAWRVIRDVRIAQVMVRPDERAPWSFVVATREPMMAYASHAELIGYERHERPRWWGRDPQEPPLAEQLRNEGWWIVHRGRLT